MDVLETNAMKKKQLIKEVLNYYRNHHYPLFFYQFEYDGKIKHITSRMNHVKSISLYNTESYYKSTIPREELRNVVIEKFCEPFSINDFVTDVCSLSPHEFIFPVIKSEGLNNLNLYQLCLDYKSYRDLIYIMKTLVYK